MKTEDMVYKYIYFEDMTGKYGEEVFSCRSHYEGHLGDVFYYPKWHQYVFEPEQEICVIFSKECLEDIADFLGKLNKEREVNNG